jgi:transposase InsO family protein
MRDGILYRKWEEPDGHSSSWQLIVPDKFRRDLFQRAHAGMTGGHLGYRKTEGQLQRRMYWPTWRTDAQLWIKWCRPCAQYHRGAPPRQAELNPFPAGDVFETLSMDITGPHPRSRSGNEYILTVMDSFSKFVEAIPIQSHSATVVARRLVDNVFSRYGVPIRLLSDQGPEFESALMAELCRSYGIEKIRTTSYKPSTNGGIERFHRTLNSMLGRVVAESQRDWDQHVAPVMSAYRSTIHASTGYTPNFLVYGRENRAPIDLVLAVDDEPEGVGTSPDVYVDELLQRQRKAYRLVRQHLGRAAERRKKEYDLHVRSRQFKRGDWVYYYYPRRYKGRSPKWSRMYTGPYLITEEKPPCNYVIQKSIRSKPIMTHADKLKSCPGETPRSWLSDGAETEEQAQAPEVPGDDSAEGGDQNQLEAEDPESVPCEPGEPEETQQPDMLDGQPPVVLNTPGSQDRALRDRGRLRRPARFMD